MWRNREDEGMTATTWVIEQPKRPGLSVQDGLRTQVRTISGLTDNWTQVKMMRATRLLLQCVVTQLAAQFFPPKAKRVYWLEVLTVNREIHSKLDGEHLYAQAAFLLNVFIFCCPFVRCFSSEGLAFSFSVNVAITIKIDSILLGCPFLFWPWIVAASRFYFLKMT